MTLEQVYAAIGGDYKGVMERLPSADFVRRFALKFLQDDSFPNLKKALEEKDAPTAFRAAHTLKGVCQNLGFDALYVPSSALTEALRGGSLDGADELFPPVEKEYQRVVEALKAFVVPLAYKNTPFPKQYTILSNKWGAVQSALRVFFD